MDAIQIGLELFVGHFIDNRCDPTRLDDKDQKLEISNSELDIELSLEAHTNALQLRGENPEWKDLSLRVYLEGKGCDGFFYGVSFDKANSDDLRIEQNGIELIVDSKSMDFVKGSKIEWIDDERGKGFLVENPNHKKFRGKFFKRENWENRLLND